MDHGSLRRRGDSSAFGDPDIEDSIDACIGDSGAGPFSETGALA